MIDRFKSPKKIIMPKKRPSSWWKRFFCLCVPPSEDIVIDNTKFDQMYKEGRVNSSSKGTDEFVDDDEVILPDDEYIRILLAEDNKITLEIMKRMLSQRSNIIVETVTDGARALELVTNTNSKNRYSLVVLDVHLVSMDGDAVVKGIRRRNIDVPILIVTADEKLAARCKRIGANEVMIKPLKRALFLAAIDELICPSEMVVISTDDVV